MDFLKKNGFVIGIGAVLVAIVGFIVVAGNQPSKYDAFAQCLEEKGAKFYGAFWCPHCQNQKKLFGTAARKLPYIECSTPDGKNQTQACIDEKISGYPTWRFADGTELSGEIPLEQLAEKTTCQLPQ